MNESEHQDTDRSFNACLQSAVGTHCKQLQKTEMWKLWKKKKDKATEDQETMYQSYNW